MRTALVITPANPSGNPRPNRMIRCLSRDFKVHVLSSGSIDLPRVSCEMLPLPARVSGSRIRRLINLALRNHDALVWSPDLRALALHHHALDHSFIVVHELWLLPLALAIRRNGRVLFDAREYYPRHFEDVWWWRLLYQPFNRSLCQKYLHQADHIVTVSSGLAAEYQRELNVRCDLLPSLPQQCALTPQPVDPDNIRMVHHGVASPSRQLEQMILMMDYLPSHFSLDLILTLGVPKYLKQLEAMCALRPRIRVLPPFSFSELVAATNAYDIGLFLLKPTNFNLRFALPNKFFEFIQARLMVAIGPSPEMSSYVREYDVGVVANDFEPSSLARALEELTPFDINRYKQNAHRAAGILNTSLTDKIIRDLASPDAV